LSRDFSVEMLQNSGIALTAEPFLRNLLLSVYRHKLGELLKRTRIEVDPEKGRSMMGTADETATLDYGQVFVQYSARLDQPNVDRRVLTGTVVIAKNPCFHPGDMRKFTAVDVPALRHMVDVVVFPVRGQRPHPNEMSGSDLDGDMYFVCWDESLIPPGPNQDPMDYTAKDKELLDRQINEEDMISFLGRYIESDQLGVIANAHLVHADAQNEHIFSEQCLELAQKHSDAVDFPKTGCLVTIPIELRPQSYPRYMHKQDKPIYRSNHVLAALYDQCKAIDSTIRTSRPPALFPDESFLISGYERYLDTARELRDFYRDQIRALAANYGVVSEAEIVSGYIHRVAQRQAGTLKQEYVVTMDLIRRHLEAIKLEIRSMFYREFGGESKKTECWKEAAKKTAAVYKVVYESDDELGAGLPWMFVDLLIWARNDNGGDCVSADVGEQATTTKRISAHNATLIGVLSDDITSFSQSYVAELRESREKRKKALGVLRSAVADRQLSGVDFICFGSTVTQCDHTSSTMDVLVVHDHNDGDPTVAVEVINEAFDASPLIKKQSALVGDKPATVSVDKQDVTIHWSANSIQRTVKILDAISKNKWMVPILNVIVSWAREKNISGSHRNCLLLPEQLVLLFIAFTEQIEQNCAPATAEYDRHVRQLLMANHFEDCDVLQCRHIDISEQQDAPAKADILLRFLHHYSQLRGKHLMDARDVSFPEEDRKLVQLADPQYGRIAERMLQAYYTLASSGSVTELMQGNVTSSKEHRVIPLARQVASIVIFRQQYYEVLQLLIINVLNQIIRAKDSYSSRASIEW